MNSSNSRIYFRCARLNLQLREWKPLLVRLQRRCGLEPTEEGLIHVHSDLRHSIAPQAACGSGQSKNDGASDEWVRYAQHEHGGCSRGRSAKLMKKRTFIAMAVLFTAALGWQPRFGGFPGSCKLGGIVRAVRYCLSAPQTQIPADVPYTGTLTVSRHRVSATSAKGHAVTLTTHTSLL